MTDTFRSSKSAYLTRTGVDHVTKFPDGWINGKQTYNEEVIAWITSIGPENGQYKLTSTFSFGSTTTHGYAIAFASEEYYVMYLLKFLDEQSDMSFSINDVIGVTINTNGPFTYSINGNIVDI